MKFFDKFRKPPPPESQTYVRREPWHVTLHVPDQVCVDSWEDSDKVVAWVTPDGLPPVSPEGMGRDEYLRALNEFLLSNCAHFTESALRVYIETDDWGYDFMPRYDHLSSARPEPFFKRLFRPPPPVFDGTSGQSPVYMLGPNVGVAILEVIPDSVLQFDDSEEAMRTREVTAQLRAGGLVMAEFVFDLPPAPMFGKLLRAMFKLAAEKIFASYCREDLAVVESIDSYLKAVGTGTFLWDMEILRAGDEWSPGIFKAIEGADSFQLFWSQYAKASENVEKEWRFALGLGRQRFIRPVYWAAQLPEPPEELRHLHFSKIKLATDH
jgi:hypothetical protein